MGQNADFDIQAAWLRRFKSDAESNLRAFALRLKEAMPEQVSIRESKSFLARTPKLTGVSVDLGDSRYVLEVLGGQLKASIALVVRGIALNTRSIEPAEWFVRLGEETRKASEQARALGQSLADFMAS
jgi:hypothetical protein